MSLLARQSIIAKARKVFEVLKEQWQVLLRTHTTVHSCWGDITLNYPAKSRFTKLKI